MQFKKQIRRLWSIHPTIYTLLKDAPSSNSTRSILLSYIGQASAFLNQESHRIEPLEYSVQNQCLFSLRKMISARSERITHFSLVKLLWSLAHERSDNFPSDLSDGFFEEMYHLFLGIRGKSGIYDEEVYPDFIKVHGRKASILRSNQLDIIASKSEAYINRYRHGLDPKSRKKRSKNRNRILKVLNGTKNDWNNYHWQLKNVIRTSQPLEALIELTREEKQGIDEAVKAKLPFGITPYYVSLMDEKPSRKYDHAIRAQVIPSMDYVQFMRNDKHKDALAHDFMLEHDTSPIDLITRRYPNIVILKPCNTCSQICVYCQRNWEISGETQIRPMASRKKLSQAIEWIKQHPAITEVLVTGGDPLILKNEQIEWILENLCQIERLDRIRIGTRTPVTLPMRTNDALIDIISKYLVKSNLERGNTGFFFFTNLQLCQPAFAVPAKRDEAIERFIVTFFKHSSFFHGNRGILINGLVNDPSHILKHIKF